MRKYLPSSSKKLTNIVFPLKLAYYSRNIVSSNINHPPPEIYGFNEQQNFIIRV
jgi:hypothetical protein